MGYYHGMLACAVLHPVCPLGGVLYPSNGCPHSYEIISLLQPPPAVARRGLWLQVAATNDDLHVECNQAKHTQPSALWCFMQMAGQKVAHDQKGCTSHCSRATWKPGPGHLQMDLQQHVCVQVNSNLGIRYCV